MVSSRTLREARLAVEHELAHELEAEGKDPEFSHLVVLTRLLRSLGGGSWAEYEAAAVAAWELDYELRTTESIPEALEWIQDRRRAGSRVVAVSDTRYSGEEIGQLLKHHGVPGISCVYASSDHAASKFSGRLFNLVAANEGVELGHIVHAGDNLFTDWLSPSERGLAVHPLRAAPSSASTDLSKAPASHEATADGAYALGYEVIGPILSAFTLLLLKEAERDGMKHLAFIARDGALLLDVARCFAGSGRDFAPSLTYLAVSRRLLSCDKPSRRTGSDVDTHPLLIAYLNQEKIFTPDTALVDIGWRGTIQQAIAGLALREGIAGPKAYYLGLWNEDGPLPPQDQAAGLLCDQRRSRTLREGAAWHAAFILEAVCRANHGMVVDLLRSNSGRIELVAVEEGYARRAEQESESVKDRVRAGVLAYTTWCAAIGCMSELSDLALRRSAQERLHRLAFFPSESERRIGHHLVHTEAEKPDWAMPLILPRGRGLAGWLAGIRSPWKGGYLAQNGNWLAVSLYRAIEAAFGRCPGLKSGIRALLPRSRGVL